MFAVACQDSNSADDDPMLAAMLIAVKETPDHSESWRMLGKVYLKHADSKQAGEAFKRALLIQSDNAAAHFDLGNLYRELGRKVDGNLHFQKVLEIAPQSDYARRVRAFGFQPWRSTVEPDGSEPASSTTAMIDEDEYKRFSEALERDSVEPVSYEIQTFDGSDDLHRRLNQLPPPGVDTSSGRLRLFAETGVLYNSNVTLTPISRELAPVNAASAQWIANAELEWTAWENDVLRFGPVGRGYFTSNESHLADLNLAGYQGGAFLERDYSVDGEAWTARSDYIYSIDQFGGITLGDRHAVSASLTRIRPGSDITFLYANVALTQFNDDGLFPKSSSLDGMTYTTGISRYFLTSWYRLPSWSLGMDLESADTEGDDFRYYSFRAHGDATFTVSNNISLELSTGLGFRSYPDFTGLVSREELTWRVAGRIDYQLSSRLTCSLVADYDRFDSGNVDFDVDRFAAGILTTFRYW